MTWSSVTLVSVGIAVCECKDVAIHPLPPKWQSVRPGDKFSMTTYICTSSMHVRLLVSIHFSVNVDNMLSESLMFLPRDDSLNLSLKHTRIIITSAKLRTSLAIWSGFPITDSEHVDVN